ncbi:MAG: hypothetical protein N4A49_03535 [Marinifilaceae bacterium]|jgi:hypothetical protein|nr:hypothetical protein [Marinifilaceae bacterium]
MKNSKVYFMRYFIYFLILLLSISCKKKKEANISFYNWKQKAEISQEKIDFLDSLDVKESFVRFFDIDIKEDIYNFRPKSVVEIDTSFRNLNINPCIYITNRSLYHLKTTDIPQLATNIIEKIYRIKKKYNLKKIKQVQIDCDWSLKTRYSYFKLLKEIKSQLKPNTILSATIRLHQIKYPKKTGIPPVDKGALMVYNMGDIHNINSKNSIFDINILKRYIGNLDKYKLKLDIAFPIFSWAVVYRFKKPVKILYPFNPREDDYKNLFAKNDGYIKLLRNGYYHGVYLYKDDILKIEEIKFKELERGAKLISNKLKNKTNNIVFYNINCKTVNKKNYENFKSIANIIN